MARVGVVSLALGAYLRRRDVRGPTKGVINRHRPTPLHITYGPLFAHPFCVFYIALLQGP
ncbi:hypothetical protein [Corallococcus sp. AB045]|uniref:hypothetical protein n=1 Tax=Corallococcus sp. AB045 TaxID=2316719 RepID=UPI0011C4AC50|nr:hypothetical protein [Corallococcus sp. AB045]